MFSSSFTMSEQKHRQWTPYKHDAPDTVESVKRFFVLDSAGVTGNLGRRPRFVEALSFARDRRPRLRCLRTRTYLNEGQWGSCVRATPKTASGDYSPMTRRAHAPFARATTAWPEFADDHAMLCFGCLYGRQTSNREDSTN